MVRANLRRPAQGGGLARDDAATEATVRVT